MSILKTIRFLKIYPFASGIILVIPYLFLLFYYSQGGPKRTEYAFITMVAFSVILILRPLPKYLMPAYSTYFTFKSINKKKIADFYITDLFRNSKKYSILISLQFSPVKQMKTRKIGKGKYEVDVSLQDGRKYTISVVPENTVDPYAGMKLLINDVCGNEFSDLDL